MVEIRNMGNYYKVVLDFTRGTSHREIGEELGEKILMTVPGYEALLDSILMESAMKLADGEESKLESCYYEILRRANDIKGQLNKDYRDEIEGMASRFSGGNINIMGDNKISVDEVYALFLIPDIIRAANCSFLAVHGSRTANGKLLMAKLFDWDSGSRNQLSEIHAVTTIKQGNKSIFLIGLLGYLTCLNGINRSRVFLGTLDAGTGGAYSSQGKRSYCFDARYALENLNTVDDILSCLKSFSGDYTYSHNFACADATCCKILENNADNPLLTAVRTGDSPLNPGVNWEFKDSIVCVNSFVFSGNSTKAHEWIGNHARWDSYANQMKLRGEKIDFEIMKKIVSYYTGELPGDRELGDIYNSKTQQIIIYEPETGQLEVFFRPKGMAPQPAVPEFEKVNIDLEL